MVIETKLIEIRFTKWLPYHPRAKPERELGWLIRECRRINKRDPGSALVRKDARGRYAGTRMMLSVDFDPAWKEPLDDLEIVAG